MKKTDKHNNFIDKRLRNIPADSRISAFFLDFGGNCGKLGS